MSSRKSLFIEFVYLLNLLNTGPNYLHLYTAVKEKENTKVERDPKFKGLIDEYKQILGDMPLYYGYYWTSIIEEKALKMNKEFEKKFQPHFDKRMLRSLKHLIEKNENSENVNNDDKPDQDTTDAKYDFLLYWIILHCILQYCDSRVYFYTETDEGKYVF